MTGQPAGCWPASRRPPPDTLGRVEVAPQTWHYGLVATWWAEFNQGGEEVEYFRRFVERSGEPALDVACGTGRLLVPYRQAGLDVDGCDVSADMVAACRRKLAEAGVDANVWVAAMDELEPPRRYRTIFVCGGFGLGATRERDLEALRRFHAALEPGGTLVFDVELPYSYTGHWPYWLKGGRGALPKPWPEGDRRTASDGSELALAVRVRDLDPLEQVVTLDIRARQWVAGELRTEEEHLLTIRLYFRDELLAMIAQAGFRDVEVFAGNTERPPTRDDDFLVFVARREAAAPRIA
jgi:SAM-dependent methyltransferase